MKLSVIIPTRNRAPLLEKALKSILAQTLSQEHFEVIVVDNGSTDNTFDVVNSFKSRLKNIRYFLERQPGLHAGRHRGLAEAESNLLVYADDDIEAFPTWLQAIQDSFGDEEVVVVGGKCVPKFEAEPPDWLNAMWMSNAAGEHVLGYLSLIDLGDDIRPVNPDQIFGCNFAVRRSVLLEAGGFHPDSMPQDLIRFRGDGETWVSKYIQSRGYKALYNPGASVYHWVPASRMTTEYFFCRSYSQGVSDSYAAIRYARGIIPPQVATGGSRDFYRQLVPNCLSGILSAVSLTARCLSLHVTGKGNPASGEAALRRSLAAPYEAGYAYHQDLVRESSELLAWVLKPDYFDCRLPLPGGETREENDQGFPPKNQYSKG